MPANRSQRQVRNAILDAPVSEYAGWSLLVSCAPCERPHLEVAVSTLGTGTVAAGLRRQAVARADQQWAAGLAAAHGHAGGRRRLRLMRNQPSQAP
jgi:hypothetical protein